MATSLLAGPSSRLRPVLRIPHTPAVLLAIANPNLQTDLLTLLRGWGHPVEPVADASTLLHALERPEAVPILILDAGLPGLHGLALLHQLHLQSARRRSWTILLTHALPKDEGNSQNDVPDSGFDDILTKPIDEVELRVSLRAASRVQARTAAMDDAIDAARFDASHDSLTGLLNRDALLKVLYQETDRTQRLGSQLSFLLLDLDQFSRINREYGYDGGDRVLRQLASRFRRFLRSYDVAGRCGGDQFLIAMPGCAQDDARSMAARLRDSVSERPFDILQATLTLTASIGVAESGGRSPLTVLREAEHALSRAKLAGGACARWFPSATTRSKPSTHPSAASQSAESTHSV